MSEPTVWAKAKAVLQERGWHQGYFYDRRRTNKHEAPVCLAGAICVAVTNHPENELHPLVDDAIGTVMARIEMQVAPWNDNPERTVDEVFALLDLLDAEEQAR